MKKIKNLKLGFTLLELLVVVLIIGILAGIALPQYLLTIDKADYTKYQSMVASLRDAYSEYVLINGKGTKHFDDLSFNLPNDFQESANNSIIECMSNQDMFCCMSNYSETAYAKLNCGKKDLSFIYSETFMGPNGSEVKSKNCYALPESSRANRLCASIGTFTGISNTRTPDNAWNNTYNRYVIN